MHSITVIISQITDIIRPFKQNWSKELSETAIAHACHEAGMTWREPLLNPVMTIQIFFMQILTGQYGHRTCTASLTRSSGFSVSGLPCWSKSARM